MSYLKICAFLTFCFLSTALYSQENIESIKTDVKYLASDQLEGRFPGSKGDSLSAIYIKEQFIKAGAKAFDNGFYQKFEVTTGIYAGDKNELHFSVEHADCNYAINKDWVPASYSENGSLNVPAVFVGYGITADDLDYDDYKNISVEGKIAIILKGIPDKNNEKSDFYSYDSERFKARIARDNGAKAVIFINQYGEDDKLDTLSYSSMSKNSGIMVLYAKRYVVETIMPESRSLKQIEEKISSSLHPESFYLPAVKSKLQIDLHDKIAETHNIVAFVEGTDPELKKESIVIGAHYDHLGFGGPTSLNRGGKLEVHNGADDNASGVSGVLDLARRIAAQPMKRSVVFIAFSAEEMGLLGSSYYVAHPLHDLSNTACMINLDMVGRLKMDKLIVFGSGSSDHFSSMLNGLNRKRFQIQQNSDGYGPSDHTSFYKHKIPVMMFFTGTHGDYHHPRDDWNLLNFKGMRSIFNFVYDIVNHLADRKEKPKYVLTATKRPEPKSKGGMGGVWFGIVPNFENNEHGCKINGTSSGSPAQKAGLKTNDVIAKIDGKSIKNLHDFMYTLREHKVGDVLKVVVLRGKDYSEKIELDVKLARRK